MESGGRGRRRGAGAAENKFSNGNHVHFAGRGEAGVGWDIPQEQRLAPNVSPAFQFIIIVFQKTAVAN